MRDVPRILLVMEGEGIVVIGDGVVSEPRYADPDLLHSLSDSSDNNVAWLSVSETLCAL